MQLSNDGDREDPAESLRVRIRGNEVRVEIIHHAEDAMMRRRISLQDVLETLQHPSQRNLEADEGKKRVFSGVPRPWANTECRLCRIGRWDNHCYHRIPQLVTP